MSRRRESNFNHSDHKCIHLRTERIQQKLDEAISMIHKFNSKGMSISEIARQLGHDRKTVCNNLRCLKLRASCTLTSILAANPVLILTVAPNRAATGHLGICSCQILDRPPALLLFDSLPCLSAMYDPREQHGTCIDDRGEFSSHAQLP